MKRLFRLGGMVALVISIFLSAELFFPDKIDYLFKFLKLPIKNEIFLILKIVFLFVLKRHANFKYYVHSEELKFITIYIILIFNQIVASFMSNYSSTEHEKLVATLVIILLLGLGKYMVEYSIYNVLAKRVKETSYQLCMFLFRITIIIRIIELIRNSIFIVLDLLAIEIPYQGIILSYSLYFVQVSNILLILSYFIIALIFLKPRETYSF